MVDGSKGMGGGPLPRHIKVIGGLVFVATIAAYVAFVLWLDRQ